MTSFEMLMIFSQGNENNVHFVIIAYFQQNINTFSLSVEVFFFAAEVQARTALCTLDGAGVLMYNNDRSFEKGRRRR